MNDGAAFCHQCGSPVNDKIKLQNQMTELNAKTIGLKTSHGKALMRVFFPILAGTISAVGMFQCYGTEVRVSITRFILCIGAILSAVETVLIIIDVRESRLKKSFTILGIVNLIAVLSAAIWRIKSNYYTVTYSSAGETLLLLSIIIVLFVLGIIATNSLIEHRKRFLISLIVLVAAFAFCVHTASDNKAKMADYSYRIEREQKEQERTDSGEADLTEAVEKKYGLSNQERYELSKKNTTIYSLLSTITGALIVLDGVVIYKKADKRRGEFH
ncbi:MAG: hypothetical protein J5633_10370 [Oscillospiraceae bacterium]|nr:hypothetical protein [Oscillospiraceae bacterium]